MPDIKEFDRVLRDSGVDRRKAARLLGMTPSALEKKLSGGAEFTACEMLRFAGRFGKKNARRVFFGNRVDF